MVLHRLTKKTVKKIKNLEIQGAAAIAEAGLLCLGSIAFGMSRKRLNDNARALASARDTEPALRNGISYALKDPGSIEERIATYLKSMEDAEQEIARIGAKRINNGCTLFLHCHSNTVMAIVGEAVKRKKKIRAVITETRPKWQGKITARELSKLKVPTTYIVDSAARNFINMCDLVLVGADAVTATGHVVNKIGTSMIALAAHEARTPFAVACSTHKFDPLTVGGELEPIEQRNPKEVWDKPPNGIKISNPAFDVTPPNYVSFIITEEGVINAFAARDLILRKYGEIQ
jgi:ribose 1,5-bisphosphate isomerase